MKYSPRNKNVTASSLGVPMVVLKNFDKKS